MIALISHRLEEYNCRRRVYGTAGENETAEFKGGGINYLIVMPILTEIFDQSYTFPIGMAYVSSSLKRTGRNVITYNLNYKSGSIEDNLRGVILDNEIDVIATGGLTAQYWQLERILQAARRVKPDIITWVGGGIITSDPVNAMDALEIADYGMIGEGEITICELADAVEGIRDPHDVAGLIFREHGKWVVTAQRKEIEDLDALPYPDYEGFEYDKVLDKIPTDIYALNQGRFGFVSFGRSCPFNCTFCFHPSGTKYRKRSMDSVFDEIDYLVEHYGIRNVAVTDELFVRKIEDVVEFCRRIRERNIGFVISLRVDMVNREMLTLLKESGCLSIGFGLESADDRVLKSMKKNITVKQIDEALGMCREIGINCNGNFIFGDQEETVETARNTIDYWKTHPEYQIAMHLIVLYPGSELYKLAVARGIIKDPVQFIKDGCPYVNISKMTDQEYRDTALEISMLSKGRTEFLKETSIEYLGFGKTNLTARCPRCGRINVWNGLDVFRSLGNVICDSCDKVMSILVSDYIGNAAEENYRKLKGHKIAIWPMTNAVAEFVDKVPSALEENTFFIDRAEVKQGARFKGKVVYAPSVIDEVRIDTVFVSVTTSIATEIIDDLQSRPSVRNIFFLGDLIKKDFSVG